MGPWFEKIQRIVVAVFFMLIPLSIVTEANPALNWLWYAGPALLMVCVLAWPITDLAVDADNLYYLRKSIIPYFNRTTTYPILEIKAIRSSGNWKDGWNRFARRKEKSIPNRLELRFKNGTSEFHDVTISRDILDKIVLVVYEMIQSRDGTAS